MSVDYTVKIFDEFYNLNLVVNASEYEVVYSFFRGYANDDQVAKSFTENLFRISNQTKIPVLDLLSTFEGQDKIKISLTMAYYLNSLGNKTILYGVSNEVSPNQSVLRNVNVLGGAETINVVVPPAPPPPPPPPPLTTSIDVTPLIGNYTVIIPGPAPAPCPPTPSSPPAIGFVLTYDTTLTGNAPIELGFGQFFGGIVNVTVNWGDLNINVYNSPTVATHTYASGGTYQVTITGTLQDFGSTGNSSPALISVDAWDNSMGLVYLINAFFEATNLSSVPINLPSTVTDCTGMFEGCTIFNDSNITLWDTSNVTNMSYMFSRTDNFNQDLRCWNTSNVTNMSSMFSEALRFNYDISSWDVSSVTDMSSMFYFAFDFNKPLDTWDVSSVTNMSGMFEYAASFNRSLNSWNVSNVTNMSRMFKEAFSFNKSLNSWNTSNVTDMSSVFEKASVFNSDITTWNLSSCTTLAAAFKLAELFNQPIGSWNTSNVADFSETFYDASDFNQALNSWNTSSAVTMASMFSFCNDFNQPLNNWDTSSVTNMNSMFFAASSFNQDLSSWCVTLIPIQPTGFATGATAWVPYKPPVWGTCPP